MTAGNAQTMNPQGASHLFISYAVEDGLLARWLARKLAARGHPDWFDQIKLLGGEQCPQTIDEAIKNRTFRMLALISAERRETDFLSVSVEIVRPCTFPFFS